MGDSLHPPLPTASHAITAARKQDIVIRFSLRSGARRSSPNCSAVTCLARASWNCEGVDAMERYEEPDDPWERPRSREARNEQTKLRGALLNAVAIALLVTAVAGSHINPALAESLSMPQRIWFALLAGGAHLASPFVVWRINEPLGPNERSLLQHDYPRVWARVLPPRLRLDRRSHLEETAQAPHHDRPHPAE
jgi:hypothetical protein